MYATDYCAALERLWNAPEQVKTHHNHFHYLNVEPGAKFDRIVIRANMSGAHDEGQRSVHAFVERATGRLVKPASWRSPAKRKDGSLQSKYDLSDTADFATAVLNADPYGSYLYIR